MDGEVVPGFVITHTMPLSEALQAFRKFRNKEGGRIKVVLKRSELGLRLQVSWGSGLQIPRCGAARSCQCFHQT